MKKFYLPVSWEMQSIVEVCAENIEEATAKLKKEPYAVSRLLYFDKCWSDGYQLRDNDFITLSAINNYVKRTLEETNDIKNTGFIQYPSCVKSVEFGDDEEADNE